MDRNTTSVAVNLATYLHVLYKLMYYDCLYLEYSEKLRVLYSVRICFGHVEINFEEL